MGFFSKFLRKKEELLDPVDLSVLHTDVHSHLIPAIDDGSKSIEDSVNMIIRFKKLGFKKLITTPHVMSDFYRNTAVNITEGKNNVNKELDERKINMSLEASAEYYLDDDLERKIENKEILPIHSKYILFELPFISEPLNLGQAIFKMQSHGLTPILAHPERYTFWHSDKEKYQKMRDKGVLLQLNLNSLGGFYSPDVRAISEWMVDNDLVDMVGTDCHRIDHLDFLEHRTSRMPYCHKLLEKDLLNKIL
ncbi:MAG: capsular biosynthesis protein [Flavobacteriales bacterium]|nr:capsular biosynthesis protein [Flavobacteriales bacterium]